MSYRRQKPIDLLDRDDLDTLMAACGGSITGVRNRGILSVLYFAGVRSHEALALTPADIKLNDDATATLNVRHGKGDRQRVVTLAAPGVRDLEAWMQQRAKIAGITRSAPIFCTHSQGMAGKPLDTAYLRAMLARLALKADLGKRIHCHGFRHAHATWLHHRGVPIAAIQVQLGHSSPLTTTAYLQSIGAHDAHQHIAQAFAA